MKVAILGLGVVGRGVYDILANDFTDITVKYVLEQDKTKIVGLEHLLADSYEQIINDKQIDVVIELIGGKTIAYDMITQTIKKGKHVVTANKALISEKFKELTELAESYHVKLLYEASVAGAIILLDPLKTIRAINQVRKIEGILNGSTNFILSQFFLDDLPLKDAISKAYELGYLEAGSDDDMNGLDPLRKINILSMIAYQSFLEEKNILRVPLSSLTEAFMMDVKRRGYLLKYIASSEVVDNQLSIRVEPLIISNNSHYAAINYEENIVSVYGKYHLKQSFIGQGAGRYPTASAIIYDVLTIKNQSKQTLSYLKMYEINHNLNKYHFLVQTKNGIYQSKLMTFKEVLMDQSIICFARIEEGLYEKI